MTNARAADRDGHRAAMADWARRALDIRPDAPEDAVRHAILTRLAQSQFVPPEPWDAAAALLADPASEPCIDDEGGYAYYRAAEDALRQRVEAFSQRFFDLPPAKRREEWSRLAEEAAFSPVLNEHLDWLEAGLDVEIDPATSGDRKLQELVDHIAAALPLPAPQRAAADFAFLEEVIRTPHGWRDAAVRLERRAPRLAAAAGDFLGRLDLAGRVAPPPLKYQTGPEATPIGPLGKLVLAGVFVLGISSLIMALQFASRQQKPKFSPDRWSSTSSDSMRYYPPAPPVASPYAPEPVDPYVLHLPPVPIRETARPTTSWKPLVNPSGTLREDAIPDSRRSGYRPFAPAPAEDNRLPWRR